jgi:hypothetical protein
MVWPAVLDRFSQSGTVPIKLIDTERFHRMFLYAVALTDSRRLTRSLAQSALPKARTIR